MAVLLGFLASAFLEITPVINFLLGGLIAGIIAGGDASRGAKAGIVAGMLSGALGFLLIPLLVNMTLSPYVGSLAWWFGYYLATPYLGSLLLGMILGGLGGASGSHLSEYFLPARNS